MRSKFAEIIAVVERYVVITRVKIKNQRSSRSEYDILSVQAKWLQLLGFRHAYIKRSLLYDDIISRHLFLL